MKTLLLIFILSSTYSLFAQNFEAKTYQVTKGTLARNSSGKIIDILLKNEKFTSKITKSNKLKVSGYFPNGKWKRANDQWVEIKDVRYIFRPKLEKPRPIGLTRYIIVDKSKFELKVYEEYKNTKKVIYTSKVATGMDRCLPKDKGGKCYFTEIGKYKIRWKIENPNGIEWCIPKSMEKEYSSDIKQGKRCFRGSLGNYALNIGKSYAIHGTKNRKSIGTKASHGCIRTYNEDIKNIYKLMRVGDLVYIVDNSSKF